MRLIYLNQNKSNNFTRKFGRKRKIVSLLVFVGLLLIFSNGIGSVSAASGNTIYVNGSSGNDTWNGLSAVYTGDNTGPKATINDAVGSVVNDGTVYIAQGTYNETNIIINKNMSIVGENQQNTIIDAQGQGQIFSITPGVTVVISNLTLTDVSSSSNGAINNNGNLIVNQTTFTNNDAASTGGAISNSNTLTVIDSNFINNGAEIGGAICNFNVLTVTGSNFINNEAEMGGAIYNDQNSMTVTDSNFTNNTGDYYAGAIFSTDTLNIIQSNFTGNSAYDGGAIWGSDINIDNSNFINNMACQGGAITYSVNYTDNNCQFIGNIPQNIFFESIDFEGNGTGNYTSGYGYGSGSSSGIFGCDNDGLLNDPNTSDNSVTKALGMKNTGIPITGLIVAVSMVIGGVLPRRKW